MADYCSPRHGALQFGLRIDDAQAHLPRAPPFRSLPFSTVPDMEKPGNPAFATKEILYRREYIRI